MLRAVLSWASPAGRPVGGLVAFSKPIKSLFRKGRCGEFEQPGQQRRRSADQRLQPAQNPDAKQCCRHSDLCQPGIVLPERTDQCDNR